MGNLCDGQKRANKEPPGLKVTHEDPPEQMPIGKGSTKDLDEHSFDKSQFESTPEYDYLLKILLIGDAGVGKTALVGRFVDKQFEDYRATIGVDFKLQTVEIDDKVTKLQLWDTAGQERFRTVTKAYFRGAHGVVIVYDITNTASWEQLTDYWMTEIEENAPHNAVLMIIGNKLDLESQRQIPVQTAKKFAKTNDALFLETSAKDDINVTKAFTTLATAITRRIK